MKVSSNGMFLDGWFESSGGQVRFDGDASVSGNRLIPSDGRLESKGEPEDVRLDDMVKMFGSWLFLKGRRGGKDVRLDGKLTSTNGCSETVVGLHGKLIGVWRLGELL